MKATEVLRRYKEGRRDFSGECLRGQSYKGMNLVGADFSGADIRGTNFTNAYLKGTKFCGVKAGLQRRWAVFLVGVSWLLSALSGIFSLWTSLLVAVALNNRFNISYIGSFIAGTVSLIVLAGFFIVTIRRGLAAGLGAVAVVIAIAAAGLGAAIGAGGGAGVAGGVAFVVTAVLATGVAVAVSGAVAVAVSGAGVVVGAVVGGGAVFGAVAVSVSGAVAVAVVGAVFGAVAVSVSGAVAVAVAGAAAVAAALVLLGAYFGWRSLKGDERDAWIRTVAIAFAATEGTSFRGADLTDADFTAARLKSTDFRRATLTRTRWHNANKLDRVRPGKTYLSNVPVRELVRTLQGQDKNFNQLSLRGVNLQGANLADASFIGSDLNEANLQDADLSRAILVQTQLDEADLTGATLTGATIEDWGITSHTQLQGVRCRYVFMRLTTTDDPNPRRKPDNWDEEFEDGDFADFIKPIVDTLDLYHNQGVDPRAIAISFKQLAENNPDAELEIVAMEKRGKDKFLLRAATAPDADHSKLNAEYFTTYNEIKALAEAEVQALLAEKDSRISSLENMIQTALQRPSFYAQTYNHQGDTMSQAPKKVSKHDFRGATFAGGFVDADTVSAEQIGGDIYNNYPSEQPQSLADAAAEIQQLLQQLEQSYPNATEFEKQSALTVTLQQEIKQNPTFRARLKNALKEGGLEALKVLFAPIGIPIEMVRGWIEAEAE
ncbi:MAG: hypothetical protein F6J86_27570 [Symploca sp. SIO1B1]|nr:hypothetical protein [Symploca sp. SIO1B1]